MKFFGPALLTLLLTSMPALAACPLPPASSTAETIQANQERLLCQQREIDAAAQDATQNERLRQLEHNMINLQIQRRFDGLPTYQPPRIGF